MEKATHQVEWTPGEADAKDKILAAKETVRAATGHMPNVVRISDDLRLLLFEHESIAWMTPGAMLLGMKVEVSAERGIFVIFRPPDRVGV